MKVRDRATGRALRAELSTTTRDGGGIANEWICHLRILGVGISAEPVCPKKHLIPHEPTLSSSSCASTDKGLANGYIWGHSSMVAPKLWICLLTGDIFILFFKVVLIQTSFCISTFTEHISCEMPFQLNLQKSPMLHKQMSSSVSVYLSGKKTDLAGDSTANTFSQI